MTESKVVWGPTLKLSTPPFEAQWAWLEKPSTRLDPAYQCSALFKPEDTAWQAIVAKVKVLIGDAKTELGEHEVHTPFSKDKEKETGEETGLILFRSSIKAETAKGNSNRPIALDSMLNPIDPYPQIGQGSLVILSIEFQSSYNKAKDTIYISAKPKAVQVLKLKTFAAYNPSDYGLTQNTSYATPAFMEGAERGEGAEPLPGMPSAAEAEDFLGGS